ncbi:MAG TPA: hypothetical protein VNJ47_00515 [Nevskiales bacterium]|nr:hypothetical protein [Nevskiales bacterium]
MTTSLVPMTPGVALAHSFGRSYNLPVPFWLYAWGAASVLVLSFLVTGYFMRAADRGRRPWSCELSGSGLAQGLHRLMPLLQALSVGGLLLCIVTGLVGSNSPYGNFNMTFFWIVFLLGFAYLTALVGDLYAALNPWKVLAGGIGRLFPSYARGRLHYPERLGYWPALVFYMAFIWIELFGRNTPFSLAVMLSVYTAINLAGAGLFGAREWFRYCEFLAVFFRLIATLAPVDYVPPGQDGQGGRLRLRAPCSGALAPAERMSLVLFLLFMLSSTAFDGLRETVLWKKLFWLDLYQAVLRDYVGANPLAAFPAMRSLFLYWQSAWLALTPFLYAAVYLAFVGLTRWLVAAPYTLRELALRFAPPLLPIALVYNITHYYTLIQTQGVKIVSLASDPLGRGWDLFGTADWLQYRIIPDAGFVWHVQVGLIVLGHVVSVSLAHRVALDLYATRRQALLSQLPMLALMVLFTVAGLWVLSQPIQSGA